MVNLLTIEECEQLLDKFCVPENIRAHSRLVSEVATFLAKELKKTKIDINVELVCCSALVHDLLKIADIKDFQKEERFLRSDKKTQEKHKEIQDKYKGRTHEEAGEEFFLDKYPEISKIIAKHGFDSIRSIETEIWSWEEKIVTYSDKRVKHDEIVSLQERFNDGRERYRSNLIGIDKEHAKKAEELFYKLEQEIFSHLDFSQDMLQKVINNNK